jgi:phosphoheptose isomerase
VFSYQLELQDLTAQDLLVLVSSSGNSGNVVKAAEYAKSKGCPVIGLTGFSGGKLKSLAGISLHVAFDNYGIVEDAHQILMHNLAQFHDLECRKEGSP